MQGIIPKEISSNDISIESMWRLLKREKDVEFSVTIDGEEYILYYVTEKSLKKIIDKRSEYPKVKFITCENNIWVACDNSSGEAYTEQFDHFMQAIAWLTLDHLTAEQLRRSKR